MYQGISFKGEIANNILVFNIRDSCWRQEGHILYKPSSIRSKEMALLIGSYTKKNLNVNRMIKKYYSLKMAAYNMPELMAVISRQCNKYYPDINYDQYNFIGHYFNVQSQPF